MNLSKKQIEMLAALHHLQPATVGAVETYLDCSTDAPKILRELIAKELVSRKKWNPPPLPLEEAQVKGFEELPKGKCGRRPYLYELTEPARRPAKLFADALDALNSAPETRSGLMPGLAHQCAKRA